MRPRHDAASRVNSVSALGAIAVGVALGVVVVAASGMSVGPQSEGRWVHLLGSSWNMTWAPGQPTHPVTKGLFTGTCLSLNGSFAPSSNTSCLIFNAEARQGGAEVLFQSVEVNPPFEAALGPGAIFYCQNCLDIGVNITMPNTPGDYTLNATVVLTT